MTRRPAVVAAWLWAIVAALWVGRAAYVAIEALGPGVLVAAVALTATAALAVRSRRRPLPVRTVSGKVTAGS